MWHISETGQVCVGFCWGDLRERAHLGDLDICRSIILKQIVKKWDGEAWARLIWLRIGTSGGLL
jgi:hypothetical protein